MVSIKPGRVCTANLTINTNTPNYKRAYGSTTFYFMVVTHKLQWFLCTELSIQFL